MKYNFIIIVFTCFICNSCNECNNTKLSQEVEEWLNYYQNKEYLVFNNDDKKDTVVITTDSLVQFDNCSFNGNCMCEIRSYSLVSENLKYSIYAYDNQIIRITIGNSINNSVLYYTKKRVFENFGNYNGSLVNFEYKNSLYEALELQCTDTDCEQLSIQRIVISKELGVLEYEDELGNVWVKQL